MAGCEASKKIMLCLMEMVPMNFLTYTEQGFTYTSATSQVKSEMLFAYESLITQPVIYASQILVIHNAKINSCSYNVCRK